MKICLMTSTYKLSDEDTNVPFLVESIRHLTAAGAQVHVFAPSYEGLSSQVLVEALNFMTPVVASNVGGIPDVIRDGETGLLVPEKDPAALAGAVVRLPRDRVLAERLDPGGLHHAQE